MSRRPQPNPRRGLLRAGIAVIVLTIVLLVVIELVSTLTAPPAKAPPVIPPSPARPIIPTPRATPHATARPTPRATPKATTKPKRDIALGGAALAELRPRRSVGTQRWIALFAGPGDAYRGRALWISVGRSGRRILVGRADPYVRPVWSPDQRSLLFVTVRATRAMPGAAWTLVRFDRPSGRTHLLVTQRAMGLWPLGWRSGEILYAVANGSDTSLYSWSASHAHELSILVPQVVSAPSLAPDGADVAFLTPADCSYCALSIFDLNALTTWFGPAGVPSEYDVAWTSNGRYLVTVLNGSLTLIDVSSHSTRLYAWPAGLPAIWADPMDASVTGDALLLVDERTGRVYRAQAAHG